MTAELMTTTEVADYLRLRQRKIYELVRQRRIPCSRITGKLLFPRQTIDLWLARQIEFDGPELRVAPPIAAGSHDVLMEWALRESKCDLAHLAGGSEDGLRRLAAGQAVLAGLHIVDPASGEYNVPALRSLGGVADFVLIEWAKRTQGLVVAPGNPLGFRKLADIVRKRARLMTRQRGAGAQILLSHLFAGEGLRLEDVKRAATPALTETDLAAAVLDGEADCGLGIEAVARRFGLGFIPLQSERFDLAMHRRDYFEPPIQKLRGSGRGAPRLRCVAVRAGGLQFLSRAHSIVPGKRDHPMNEPPPRDPEVLIVGAGPTGLVLALWLARLGVSIRIVDKTAEPGTTSRALAVQARTLEFYRQMGFAETVVERGRHMQAVNLWVAGKRKARAVFGDIGSGLSPFPYALTFPQDEHERLLIDLLSKAGVTIERRTELLDFAERTDDIVARLKRADGSVERCETRFIAGCDGAHSTVRETLQIGFAGGTYEHLFHVADVEASGAAMNGDLHVAFDSTDFLAVFPLKGEG